jgi:pyruvate ferredoxin oxidoreductase gamma subunit
VTNPDIVVILDPGLIYITDVTSGLKKDGTLVINTPKTMVDIKSELGGPWKLAVVNANTIARELLGVPIVNTTMLGALIKATGIIRLESLTEPIKERFGARAKGNIDACRRAFDETEIAEPGGVVQKARQAIPAPRHIAPAIGNLRIRFGTMRNVSSAEFVICFVRKDVSERKKTVTLKPIYIIARDVVFVRESAGQRL